MADWLVRAGLDVTLNDVAPGRPNVIGVARGSGGGRTLMLNAHLDTVGVAGMQHPHDPRVEGNRLYGRGGFDMKGGLAAIMLAGAAATQQSLSGASGTSPNTGGGGNACLALDPGRRQPGLR